MKGLALRLVVPTFGPTIGSFDRRSHRVLSTTSSRSRDCASDDLVYSLCVKWPCSSPHECVQMQQSVSDQRTDRSRIKANCRAVLFSQCIRLNLNTKNWMVNAKSSVISFWLSFNNPAINKYRAFCCNISVVLSVQRVTILLILHCCCFCVSLEGQIKDVMHKAFWDSLAESLQEDPPDYTHALVLLKEVKEVITVAVAEAL